MEAQPQNQGLWRRKEEREKEEEDEERVFLEFEYPSPEAQLIPTLLTLPFCHSPSSNSSYHDDYASDLDSDANSVSRSTLKRKCRKFNIDCWPSSTRRNARNVKSNSGSASTSEYAQMNSSTTANPVGHEQNPELLQALNHCLSTAIIDGTCVIFTVKVFYKEDVIIFDLSSTSGFTQLTEEVGRRLNLDSSSFKIKYHDEDDDLVLITCDSDLQYFLCNSELSKTVELLIYDSM
ncbi:protein NLP6-like [Chenopodium quinoa]|uniref:protein NLP6-like n=1 Tax=Chenopodium quinoa TaxID=63459 RepID=UPI000B76BEAA|nr:protein NLP6-like [Chenopodium quinoa]